MLPIGKKFSTVDKSWRQAISAAKVKPKAIEFCDNAKLLEKFKESEILLDQVQKGNTHSQQINFTFWTYTNNKHIP